MELPSATSSPRPLGLRHAGYLTLAILAAIPVGIFVIAGVDAQGIGLTGFGGPMVAFSAGVLSFLSPCVLPIVPIYITNLAGTNVENGKVIVDRRRTFAHAVAFVTGLSLIFVGLGASVGLIGFGIRDNIGILETGAGVLMILLGALLIPSFVRRPPAAAATAALIAVAAFVAIIQLADLQGSQIRVTLLALGALLAWGKYSGYVQFNLLQRTFKTDLGGNRKTGYARSAVIGGAFATGWTPCVGPILGGILALAASSGDVLTGTYLLLAYSAGFSIPFLVAGLAVGEFTQASKKVQRFMPAFEFGSAVMMIGIGALLLSGQLSSLNEYFGFAEFNQGL